MNPNMNEFAQVTTDGLPAVAAIEPIENSTSAGSPLATQNAPTQLIFRCSIGGAPAKSPRTPGDPVSFVTLMSLSVRWQEYFNRRVQPLALRFSLSGPAQGIA